MANDLDIYEAIAVALADVRAPDLSPFAPSLVGDALTRALSLPAARASFLAWIQGRVQSLSGGRVSIEERPDGDAPPPSADTAYEVPLRLVIRDEPFAESAILRADNDALQYPMRG